MREKKHSHEIIKGTVGKSSANVPGTTAQQNATQEIRVTKICKQINTKQLRDEAGYNDTRRKNTYHTYYLYQYLLRVADDCCGTDEGRRTRETYVIENASIFQVLFGLVNQSNEVRAPRKSADAKGMAATSP